MHAYCKKTYINYKNYQPFSKLENRQILPHCWSDTGFKGTVVNEALSSLYGGSFKVTLESL